MIIISNNIGRCQNVKRTVLFDYHREVSELGIEKFLIKNRAYKDLYILIRYYTI